MPAFQVAIAKHDSLRATIEPVNAEAAPENPLRTNGLLDARAKALGGKSRHLLGCSFVRFRRPISTDVRRSSVTPFSLLARRSAR
jgi:hypothetical protein